MTDNPTNAIASMRRQRSKADADVPEAVRRRYFVDGRGGGGLGYFVDAQVQTAAFRDSGRRLTTGRNDPNAIRDMVRIAQHRQWAVIRLEGDPTFKREAWLAAASVGLEVRGYKPTNRDRQDLEHKLHSRDRAGDRSASRPFKRGDRRLHRTSGDPLQVVESVVRARIADPRMQKRVLDQARTRLADLLERGAKLLPLEPNRVGSDRQPNRERTR